MFVNDLRKGDKMGKIIFLEPIFKEMIWGGNRLSKEFAYNIPSEKTGECWAISAHKNGDCVVRSGEYKGMKLSELWDSHRELFGNIEGDTFPLLTKIIDAKEDLSIQVHPDDKYAKEFEAGASGKTECWYILDCDENAQIVLGHNAKDKDELKEMIEKKKWNELIRIKSIKKGDFFQINPGTVHAIKAGTLILETQQNSDITYRLYDYDRLSDGVLRELHIDKSIDVIRCPHEDTLINPMIIKNENCEIEELYQCNYYQVKKIKFSGVIDLSQKHTFTIVSVINGCGTIDQMTVTKGDHFILPTSSEVYKLKGNMEFITSTIGEKRQEKNNG